MAPWLFRDGHRADETKTYAGRHSHPEPAGTDLPGDGQPAEPGGPWAPVVVGEPIFDFEPTPPGPGFYCPDTIVDGWSTEHLTMRLASVRGYAHRYRGTPRQDAAVVACDPSSGGVAVAVADGVSSAPHSHYGATAACWTATDAIARQLAAGQSPVDWIAVIKSAAAAVMARGRTLLRNPRPDPEAVEELLATTLTAGCITPTAQGLMASVVQVGDSGGWLLHGGRYRPVLAPKNDRHAEVISSAVAPLPRVPARVKPVTVQLPAGSVLLLGTDGFGDPLGDGSGMVGQLFAEQLSSPPPAGAFAHLLDFSRETFDDDRTLVAVWPQPPDEGASR